MKEIKTTAALLTFAAEELDTNVNPKNGRHISMFDAVFDAADQHKFSNRVIKRALTVIDMLYTSDSNRLHDFGKQFSETRNEHAINSVARNREHRVTALLMAAEVSKSPIRNRVKRAVTSPSIAMAPQRWPFAVNNAGTPTTMMYNEADICR